MNYNEPSVDTGRRLYYSSSQGPFYNANNIFMFYGGGNRGRIVESVIRAVRQQEPIIHVHGESGSGKTMLSLVISDRIKQRYHTMRYDLPEISAAKLLRHLLIELVPQSSDLISSEQAQNGADDESIDKALLCIEEQLGQVRHSLNNKPYILFIDSKDSLDADALQVIERLSSFRVDQEHIMHCVVFHTASTNAECYSALGDTPYQSENHFWLRRLTLAEINEYLRHHMMLFDFNRRELFTKEMAYFIADRSEGVFKSINTLARNAFTIANLEDADKLSMSHLLMAGLPMPETPEASSGFLVRHPRTTVALMGSCVVGSMALVLYLFG
ncbi:MAG: AAA family ATPase [Granulosicoccus sp.]